MLRRSPLVPRDRLRDRLEAWATDAASVAYPSRRGLRPPLRARLLCKSDRRHEWRHPALPDVVEAPGVVGEQQPALVLGEVARDRVEAAVDLVEGSAERVDREIAGEHAAL